MQNYYFIYLMSIPQKGNFYLYSILKFYSWKVSGMIPLITIPRFSRGIVQYLKSSLMIIPFP